MLRVVPDWMAGYARVILLMTVQVDPIIRTAVRLK